MTLKQRYDVIAADVAQCCVDSQRSPEEVRIIGVSKTVGIDKVEEAIAAGVHDFGENRPEELVRKHDAFPHERWHFIGNIQSRQLPQVVGRATLIHSLYQERHAAKISRLAQELGIVQDVLVEVNDGEENKQGIDACELMGLLEYCAGLEGLRVVGLMGMAPQGSPAAARETFARLRALRDKAQAALDAKEGNTVQLHEISMGMSDDYRFAIPEGATMVRIGRAIFSDDYAG